MIGLKVAAVLSIVAFVVAVIAISQYLYAKKETKRAEFERNKAVALRLVAEAQLVEQNPNSLQLQTLLAIESMKRFPSLFANQTLKRAMELMPKPLMTISHEKPVLSMEISKDGKYLAIGSEVNIVRVWDLSNGKLLWRLEHGVKVIGLSFSYDGKI